MDTASGDAWYYKLGIGGNWTSTKALAGFNTANTTGADSVASILAVAFSPNFASDQVMTVVCKDTADARTTLEMLSVSTTVAASTWNQASGFTNYPVAIEKTEGNGILAECASIALAPTYLGGDEVERIAFVGIIDTVTDASESGVYRLEDYTDKAIMTSKQIYSVAYDGVTCVAGETNTIVWRSSDPLSSIPTFYATATTKAPGGAANPVLAWAGTSVVAVTSGIQSALSVSVDDGKSFSDISLIDTSLTTIDGIAVSSDGTHIYMVTNDGTNTSLWRMASQWRRVLSIPGDTGYIVRMAPDNADVVYAASTDSAAPLYYSKEGGDAKWYSRASIVVADLAVESEDVAYLAPKSSKAVRKTTNAGFTWGTAEDTLLAGGYVNTIACIGEDKVVVGSDSGYVCYSADGNDSWNKINIQVGNSSTPVQVTADGLETGDHIWASNTGNVYRWTIGQTATDPWKSMAMMYGPNAAKGILLAEGYLYALAADSTIKRNGAPTMPDPAPPHSSTIDTGTFSVTASPSALGASTSETMTKLWVPSGGVLYSYMDTLAGVSIELLSPPDGAEVKINTISGYAADVAFSWKKPNKVTACSIEIALAVRGDKVKDIKDMGTPGPSGGVVIGPGGSELSPPPGSGPRLTVMDTRMQYVPGTTYYWKVKASLPISSDWSETRSFTIEAASALAPAIGSPANGATVTNTTPAFSWSPVAGTVTYEFQVAADTTFGAPLVNEKLTSTAYQATKALEVGKTYFWRVRALEPIPGEWSTIANFAVGEAVEPGPPPTAPPVEVTVPEIEIPPITVPPAQVTVEQPTEPAAPVISETLLWVIIIIGAILVIALIVLIVRTRRTV
jgi:hypothetical protein